MVKEKTIFSEERVETLTERVRSTSLEDHARGPDAEQPIACESVAPSLPEEPVMKLSDLPEDLQEYFISVASAARISLQEEGDDALVQIEMDEVPDDIGNVDFLEDESGRTGIVGQVIGRTADGAAIVNFHARSILNMLEGTFGDEIRLQHDDSLVIHTGKGE